MKNIHILPTDKPSRLVKIKDNLFYTTTENIPGGVYQHIYITSDEKIKEGDWLYHRASNKLFKYDGQGLCVEVEKIILTTDQELIKDGVQTIDDEFLEWFVKNPSCEEIDVKPMLSNNGRVFYGYKIIIPSEEPKQFTTEMLIDLKQGLDNAIQKSNPLFPNFDYLNKIKNKETLEEAAEKQWGNVHRTGVLGFIDGAKWQQKNSYSEEDMRQSIFTSFLLGVDRGVYSKELEDELIEQFKKK
jgi:hypothetical protein